MDALFKRGDVVKLADAGYAVVVSSEQGTGTGEINVTLSLADKPKWTKYFQSKLDKVEDVSLLPDEIQEALTYVDIDNEPNSP
ncbi:MAG: hypothetical protein IJU37_12960 [Desulfovibrio sp.]|nr:hypothetical protein [Desulfovibrio sp.]